METTKLAAIIAETRRALPEAPEEAVESYINADWPEGRKHLAWLNRASVATIAAWAIEGLRNQDFSQEAN